MDDSTRQPRVTRRAALKAASVAAVSALVIAPAVTLVYWSQTRRRLVARCRGPFSEAVRVTLDAPDSDFVEPKSFRIVGSGKLPKGELSFLFKGDNTRERKMAVSITGYDRSGRILFVRQMLCSDGRSNAEPVYMFGRKLFGSSVNTEIFRIASAVEQIDSIEAIFTET